MKNPRQKKSRMYYYFWSAMTITVFLGQLYVGSGYRLLHNSMQELMGKVVAGEEINVCGYCTSVASLIKSGAAVENIVTEGSDIMLISSTDKASIQKIHDHAEKTIAFLKAAHAGHDH